MSSSNNNDNGGFYTSDRRRGSDEATSSGISTSLFGGTNYTSSKPKSKSTNNSRASDMSSIGSNGNKLLHHIEKRVSSGKSCNISELLNLLEKKVNGSDNDDRGREGRLSSSKSCGGTSINATAQSNAAQVRTSSSGSVRTSSGRVRRLLLEQDASMSSSIATSTKPVFTNNNNNIQSLSYNHIDDDYSRSYNSSLATHITAQTTTGNSGLSPRSRTHSNASTRSIMEEDESLASIEDNNNDGNSLDGNSFFSIGNSSLPSRISHITNTSTSTAGTTLSLVLATIIQSNFNNCKCQKLSSKQLLGLLMAICLILNTIYNMTSSTSSLLTMRDTNIAEVEQQLVREERVFSMCNRLTPYQYAVNPTLQSAETNEILEPFGYGDKPIDKFNTNWGQPSLTSSSQKKILLLRNDGKFGHIGNQFNSILHAFDYAKDFHTHIGIFGHSWFMDVIQSMFYETLPIYSDIEDDEEEVGGSNGKFDKLDQELYQDFGIIVIRNQTQLQSYSEIIYKTAEELYFYHSSKESWRIDMYNHILILRQLYMRYNRGLGVIHNGLQSQNVCDVLNLFFEDGVAGAKYSVIHARYLDGNAVWRLERLASATGMTIEGGVMQMGPAYVKGILKPLNMLDHPIILITDGQLAAVERGLLNDEILGPKLMVLSDKDALDGADVALAVLADVFIGNPASVTSGFIARSRMALGYSDKSTQLFRTLNPQEHRWSSVCNEECVFNPYVMERFV